MPPLPHLRIELLGVFRLGIRPRWLKLVELTKLKKLTTCLTARDRVLSPLALNTNVDLAGSDPRVFWRNANFLDIQGGGNSQTEILALFSGALSACHGFTTAQCGSEGGPFVYLDDAVFTGNRVRSDVIAWLPRAPSPATLHVIVIAFHRGGKWYADTKIRRSLQGRG